MATLAELAAQAHRDELDLLAAASARGDLAATTAEALGAGRALFLLAEGAQSTLAHHVADAIRRPFDDDVWPPVATIVADTRPLALIGCDYAVARPITHQVEMLVRTGDVAMVLADPEPSADLRGAVGLAASQGAVVAGLGLPPCGIQADPAVALPAAPADRLALCQLALGRALARALRERLPAEHPPGVEPALIAFECANCGAALTVRRHLAGRTGVCPCCYNNTVLAPGHDPDHEHRASLRFALRQCTLQVALAPRDKPLVALPGDLALENLGSGGLRFAAPRCPIDLQPGNRLVMELDTPAFRSPILLDGSINRVVREADLHRVGVVFDPLTPATAERLRILERNLVLRNLAHRPAPASSGE